MVFLTIDSNDKVELIDDHRFSVKSTWINVHSNLMLVLSAIVGGSQCVRCPVLGDSHFFCRNFNGFWAGFQNENLLVSPIVILAMKTWAPSESESWLNENLERYEENLELRKN
jgi:hypothetical protein